MLCLRACLPRQVLSAAADWLLLGSCLQKQLLVYMLHSLDNKGVNHCCAALYTSVWLTWQSVCLMTLSKVGSTTALLVM